jgi:hypothetical protein
MSHTPWTTERRATVKRKIDKEAERAAIRIGAKSVVIIAFFSDGEYLHLQDGGNSPVPNLYEHLATARQVLDESGGADVALS